jgi:hypothetical protein
MVTKNTEQLITEQLNTVNLNNEIKTRWNPKLLCELEISEFIGNEDVLKDDILNIRCSLLINPDNENPVFTANNLIKELKDQLKKYGKSKFNSCIAAESMISGFFENKSDALYDTKDMYGPIGYYTGEQGSDGKIKNVRAWIVMRGFFE